MSESKNVFDPAALLASLRTLLLNRELSSPQDALASMTHTVLVALDFRLVSLSEDGPTLQGASEVGTIPEGWNKAGPVHYFFKYKHHQSSLEFLIKLSKFGHRTIINGIATQTEKTATLDISTSDYTSPSFFPYTVKDDAEPLVHGFISSARVTDFVSSLKTQVVQPLLPGLIKSGYSEEDTLPRPTTTGRPPAPSVPQASQPPDHEPFNLPPRRPDPYAPPVNPLEIGRRDREPIPYGSPFAPPPMFPGGGDGDGMFVGPNHPIFGARGPGMGGRPGIGGRGPWGGDGFLPPMGTPPGARFDPIGPGPLPGFGGRAPQRSGDPDNDEPMPPGAVSRSC